MKRPVILRILPDRLRLAAWARMYKGRHDEWLALYRSAALRYAPGASMELVPGDVISDSLAFTGVYEPSVTRRFASLARRGGILIDIGANLGYFAILWTAANPRNRCVAFEASPRNIDLLRRNISRNGLDERIEVHPVAAGHASGKLRFDPGPREQTGWGGFTVDEGGNSFEVEVMRVDEIVDPRAPIALLKIDIEGADAWALMGCERLFLSQAVQEVWFEQNKPRIRALGIPLDAAQDYLRSVGYTPSPQGDPFGDLVQWAAVPARDARLADVL